MPKVSGPGGDVSTSASEGGLGAPWRSGPTLETDGKSALGIEWTQSNPCSAYLWFLDLQRNFASSRMQMAWETKATLEASLSFGKLEGKVSLVLEKPDA